MGDVGFRGTSSEQDGRFSDKEKKLLKQMKFEDVLEKKVNLEKVKMDVIKPWITMRVNKILGIEDDVVIEYILSQLEEKNLNPKIMQINITGFLNARQAREFMSELWVLLVEANEAEDGIPKSLVEKKLETMKLNQSNSEDKKPVPVVMAESDWTNRYASLSSGRYTGPTKEKEVPDDRIKERSPPRRRIRSRSRSPADREFRERDRDRGDRRRSDRDRRDSDRRDDGDNRREAESKRREEDRMRRHAEERERERRRERRRDESRERDKDKEKEKLRRKTPPRRDRSSSRSKSKSKSKSKSRSPPPRKFQEAKKRRSPSPDDSEEERKARKKAKKHKKEKKKKEKKEKKRRVSSSESGSDSD